jgi:hypothetical protein
MKLYCNGERVVAWHTDDQNVPATAYGEGIEIVQYDGPMGDLERLGDEPPAGMLDGRPYRRPPLQLGPAGLIAYAADARWRREVGGILVGGVSVATDDRSKTMVLGARVAATANAAWETVWHGADGQIYPLNAAAMIAISDAVEAHVNGTFATFAIVKAEIEAGEITTLAEIDAAFV